MTPESTENINSVVDATGLCVNCSWFPLGKTKKWWWNLDCYRRNWVRDCGGRGRVRREGCEPFKVGRIFAEVRWTKGWTLRRRTHGNQKKLNCEHGAESWEQIPTGQEDRKWIIRRHLFGWVHRQPVGEVGFSPMFESEWRLFSASLAPVVCLLTLFVICSTTAVRFVSLVARRWNNVCKY